MKETTAVDSKRKNLKPFYYFFGSLIVALVLTWLLKEPEFTASQVYVLFLLFFSVGLWVTEAIPPFAVGLFIMAYLVFTLGSHYFNSEPEVISSYVNTFSSRIIWLLLGGFFLAAAMTKTELDKAVLAFTLKISGAKPRNILIAFMSTAMFFSMIMSSTVTTAMMVAALAPLLKASTRPGLTKALLLGICIAATLGGMGTIIGISSNAVAAGMLGDNGIKIDFLTWMLYGVPLAIMLTALTCIVLLWVFVKDKTPVSLEFLENKQTEKPASQGFQRNLVLIVLIITILLWLTSSLHGVSVAGVAAIPIVVFTLTGIIKASDVNRLPWDTLLLIAGGLSLGEALQSTGILEHFGGQMRALHVSDVTLLLFISYVSMVLATIMSNAATCALLVPLGFALLPNMQLEVALCVALASSTGLLLPVATPATTIAYSTGFLEPKDFRIGGLLAGILGPLLCVLWVLQLSR